MSLQLGIAQNELAQIATTSYSQDISQVYEVPYHPEWMLEPTLEDLASTTAAQHGLDTEKFVDTIDCESHFNITAVGDHNTSFGVSQIHLPAHPDVSLQEADDPIFSFNWMAQQWVKGNQDLWSCYTKLFS